MNDVIDVTKNADVLWNEQKRILSGVVAYVEVWDDFCFNYSEIWREKLEDLGAKVARRLTPKVTHVIYKDGQEKIKAKAKELGCHLVSVLWVAEIESTGKLIPESRFPFTDKPVHLKPKRFKNMVEEEVIRTPEKTRKERFIQTLRERRKPMLDQTSKRLADKMADPDETGSDSEENLATMVCETPLKRGMFVPNTQKRTPPRLDATLTTLVPETPPELRGCPQSTKLARKSVGIRKSEVAPADFKLDISDLTLSDSSSLSNITATVVNAPESRTVSPPRKLPGKRRSMLLNFSPKKRVSRKSLCPKVTEDENPFEGQNSFEDTEFFLNKTPAEFASPERTSTSPESMSVTRNMDRDTGNMSRNGRVKGSQNSTNNKTRKLARNRDLSGTMSTIDETTIVADETKTNADESTDETFVVNLKKTRRRTRLSIEKFKAEKSHIKNGPIRKDLPSIVANGVREKSRKMIIETVEKLGGLDFTSGVKFNTTHCITTQNSRTKMVLKALAMGAWILSVDYVKQSASRGKWMSESAFELSEYASREKRMTANPTLFHSLSFRISDASRPPKNFLQEIIEICGGGICHSSPADFVIGQIDECERCFDERWILDMVSSGERLDEDEYRIK